MTQRSPSTERASGYASPEDRWRTGEITDLADALIRLRTRDEALRFLRDLCTINELKELGQRWHVARLLDEGVSYHEISDRTGASSATISRVAQWLRYGRDGYRLVIDRVARRRRGGRGS
jgi:TrpR-related protein YerC/YecD